jgi:hypothetical protein
MEKGEFYIGNTLVFRMTNIFTDDEAEDMKMKITAHNGYVVRLDPNNSHKGYSSGIVVSGDYGNARGHTNGSGKVWMKAYVFLPQSVFDMYGAGAQPEASFKLWDQDNDTNGGNCTFPYGRTVNLSGKMPTLSATPELNVNDGCYDVGFTIHNRPGYKTGTVYIEGAENHSSVLSGSASNGSYTTNLDFLRSDQPTVAKKLAAKWIHSATGLVYEIKSPEFILNHVKKATAATVINNNDGTVSVRWEPDAGDEPNAITHYWRVQYQIDGGEWRPVANNIAKGTTICSFTIPTEELNRGAKNYNFRVNRDCFNAGVLSVATGVKEINTNYEIARPLTQGGSVLLYTDNKVYFKVIDGIVPTGFSYEVEGNLLSAQGDNGAAIACNVTERIPNTHALYGQGYRWRFTPQNIQSCSPYVFRVQAKVNTSTYGTQVESDPLMWTPNLEAEIVSFGASKGFFNNRVELKWDVHPDKANFTHFKIVRYLANDASGESAQVVYNQPYNRNTAGYSLSLSDSQANAGAFYRYRLTGETQCADNTTESAPMFTIGYAQAFGSVSGKVLFEGTTTGVPNVDMICTNNNADDDLGKNKALDFGSANEPGYFTFPTPWRAQTDAQTFQMWLKLDSEKPTGQGHQLFYGCVPTVDDTGAEQEPEPQVDIWLDENRRLNFELFGDEPNHVTLHDTVFPLGKYFHYSGVLSRHNGGYTLVNYLNGLPVGELSIAANTPIDYTLGRVSDNETDWKIDGKADEIRVWNRALTANEIAADYNRYINTAGNGLMGYYRFDEPDGAAEEVFDFSKNASLNKWNENHGKIVGNAVRTTAEAPAPELLALKARTAVDGSYNTGDILPYGGVTQYRITPTLGTHRFAPDGTTLTISTDNPNRDQIDFVDNSKFTYTGAVVYSGGNYPVEGCQFLVNGALQTDETGQAIKSDVDGRFTLTVPVGTNTVRIVKQGHRFEQETITKNFQDDENGFPVRFKDDTRIRIIGRVVGGTVESGKSLGFGLSENNVGESEVVLQAERGTYRFVDGTKEATMVHFDTQYSNSVWYGYDVQNAKSEIRIKTNAATGEFYADIYPEKYLMTGIWNGNAIGRINWLTDAESMDKTGKVTLSPEAQLYLTNESLDSIQPYPDTNPDYWQYFTHVDSIAYNDTLVYTHRVNPTMTVTELDAQGTEKYLDAAKTIPYYGEKDFTYTSPQTQGKETVMLVEPNGSKPRYTFVNSDSNTNPANPDGYPVYAQSALYNYDISVREVYHNWQTGTDSRVPVAGGEIRIRNEMAAQTAEQAFVLDSLGMYRYSQTVSNANIAGGLRSIEFSYPCTSAVCPGQTIEAIVLGGESTGTNFTTQGTDQILFVLRDPPGNNSYAYWETETTIESEESITVEEDMSTGVMAMAELGNKNQIMTLAGVGVVTGLATEFEATNNLGLGLYGKQAYNEEGKKVTTISVKQRIETSADPDYAGPDADVFVGISTNQLYGYMNSLMFADNTNIADFENDLFKTRDNRYHIGKHQAISFGRSFGTTFFYTQKRIRDEIIPEWKTFIADAVKTAPAPANISKPYYHSLVPTDDEHYGKIGYYDMIYPAGWDDAQKLAYNDTVSLYNRQIVKWERTLALNEGAKVRAMKNNTHNFNYSFGDGVTIDYANVKTEMESSSSSAGGGFTQKSEGNIGIKIAGYGVQVTVEEELNFKRMVTYGDSQTKSSTMGFVLSTSDVANKLTVDIYDGNTLKEPGQDSPNELKYDEEGIAYAVNTDSIPGGFIFVTRGGQTSCPHEDEYITQYYQPGTVINSSTMRNEVPDLRVLSQQTVSGVPADGQAVYQIQLLNNSESHVDRWYDLRVQSNSNPDGAVIRMDGAILTENGQPVFVPYGETGVLKTITIERGPQAYNYENIRLAMASQCQYYSMDDVEDIFSAVELSASFLQGCSDVLLAEPIESWIMNTNSHPADILTIKVTGFDQHFANLGWINIQYKESYASQWTTFKRYYFSQEIMDAVEFADEALYDATTMNGVITENWDLPNYDGNYEVRAVMVCAANQGSEEQPNYQVITQTPTPARAGVRDMLRPEIFGRPEPRDGVLDIDDEIMVQFNEPIIGSRITTIVGTEVEPNIRVRGIRSEGTGPKHHPAAIRFDGTSKATFQNDMQLKAPFTIEMWLRPTFDVVNTTGDYTLFTHGDNFRIGLSGNQVDISANGQQLSSEYLYTTYNEADPEWAHIAISYDASGIVKGYYAHGATTVEVNGNLGAYNQTETAEIGSGFVGDIHDLRIWDTNRNNDDIVAAMTATYNGVENGLKHYWRMDEMQGTQAIDLAGGLNATLDGAIWKLSNPGKAVDIPSGSALKLPGDFIARGTNDDYTIELWFKGANQTNATLFSAGNGGADTDYESDNGNLNDNSSAKLSIYFNSQGHLAINSKGATYATTTGSYSDNQWHHLAFSVNRLSNAGLYVDGNLIYFTPADNIGGIAADSIYIGQRKYTGNHLIDHIDYPFAGQIDEVRIWNAALDAAHVKDFKNRIIENTMGLAAYYPFEKYTDGVGNFVGTIVVSPTLEDMVNTKHQLTATLGGTATISSDYAPVKSAGAQQDLGYRHVVNGDKILISLTEPRNRIEQSFITVTMQGIQDLNGNEMGSSLILTALVNQTQLRWSQKTLEFEGAPGGTISQTIQLVNSGGTAEDYTISDIPAWLSISAADRTGSVPALSDKTITISVPTTVNVGNYEQTLLLNGASVHQLTVKANIHNASPADWTVNPSDYEHNATVVAALLVDGVYSTDTSDKLAIFSGNECRGVANIAYDDTRGRYSVYLTVYSNNFADENFIYRIWDNSRSDIRQAVTNAVLDFANGHSYGSVTTPIVFEATDAKLSEIPLDAGWNWISINVTNDDMSAQQLFGEISDNMLLLKNKTDFSVAFRGEIIGELATIDNTQMYKIRMREASVLHTAGTPVVPAETPITLHPGWNWIAYTPQGNLSTQQALSGLQADANDLIKSQTAFAVHTDGHWQGSLATIEAGKGYVYQRVGAGDRTFTYPYIAAQGTPIFRAAAIQNDVASIFTPIDANVYENNMSIIALVKNGNDTLKNVEIGAFIGDECRGAIRSRDNGIAFLTVSGATEGHIHFKVYNHDNGTLLTATQTLPYESDMVTGAVQQPYIINWDSGVDGIDHIFASSFTLYPNPAKDELHIKSSSPIHRVEIYSLTGSLQIYNDAFNEKINISSLPQGVYMVKIRTSAGTAIQKMVKE